MFCLKKKLGWNKKETIKAKRRNIKYWTIFYAHNIKMSVKFILIKKKMNKTQNKNNRGKIEEKERIKNRKLFIP